MPLFLLASLTALLASPQSPSGSPILINEAVVDDEGSDDREFVELYNRSTQTIDISAFTLEVENRRGLRATYTIPPGTSLAPCDYWVLGSATVPHVDQVLSGANLFVDNTAGALILKDAAQLELDRLVYHATFELWPTAQGAGEGFWGESTSFDGFETSISRWRDGWNELPSRAFVLQRMTPGEPNAQAWVADGEERFDGAAGSEVLSWQGTRAALRRIDPLQVGPLDSQGLAIHPQALPVDSASVGGSGGSCAVLWNTTAGGSAAFQRADGLADIEVEALFWLRSDPLGLAQMEHWCFGVQGTTDAYARIADPSGAIGFVRSGNTGVAWIFQALDSGATLYLVDHGDGGWAPIARTPPTLLATIVIRSGLNDGWQRLRLRCLGGQVEAEFGGTLGSPGSGSVYRHQLQEPADGSIYLGYDRLLGNAAARPLTIDDLRVRYLGTPPVQHFGSAGATPAGTPNLHVPYAAAPGELRFELQLDQLAAGALAHFVIGSQAAVPAIDLAPFGATNGATLEVLPQLICVLPVNAQGLARLPLPIVCDPSLRGREAFAQGLSLEPLWNVPLPLGTSRGVRFVLR